MKKKELTLDGKIDKLTVLVECGFSAVADDLAEIKGDITDIKVDIAAIKNEIRDIKNRLDSLDEAVEGMKGYAKEIDELRSRIAVIERHLHLRRKSAV